MMKKKHDCISFRFVILGLTAIILLLLCLIVYFNGQNDNETISAPAQSQPVIYSPQDGISSQLTTDCFYNGPGECTFYLPYATDMKMYGIDCPAILSNESRNAYTVTLMDLKNSTDECDLNFYYTSIQEPDFYTAGNFQESVNISGLGEHLSALLEQQANSNAQRIDAANKSIQNRSSAYAMGKITSITNVSLEVDGITLHPSNTGNFSNIGYLGEWCRVDYLKANEISLDIISGFGTNSVMKHLNLSIPDEILNVSCKTDVNS